MALEYVFEIAFIVFLVLGVLFSFVLQNTFLQSLTILVFGMLAATFQRLRKADLNFPYVLIVIGFVVGYLIATKSNRFFIFILFLIGIFLGLTLEKLIKNKIESKK